SQAKNIFVSPAETPRPMNRVFVKASDGRKITILCRPDSYTQLRANQTSAHLVSRHQPEKKTKGYSRIANHHSSRTTKK
ncbi:MAG: hypothetical protein K6T88_06635, partial [Bacillus sp. (in: Bacteria)]|nr:hypothetical protein [Bacillus sp. (in: firmicutes)]